MPPRAPNDHIRPAFLAEVAERTTHTIAGMTARLARADLSPSERLQLRLDQQELFALAARVADLRREKATA